MQGRAQKFHRFADSYNNKNSQKSQGITQVHRSSCPDRPVRKFCSKHSLI